MEGYAKSNTRKHTYYAIGCLVSCIVLELTSIGCTLSYHWDYNEADKSISMAAYILVAVAVVVQLLSCFFVSLMTRVMNNKFNQSKRDKTLAKPVVYGAGVLSIPSLGPLQLAAAILMSVSTANNDDSDVQGYASVIVGLNFASAILAAAFGVFFYIPMEQEKRTDVNNSSYDRLTN